MAEPYHATPAIGLVTSTPDADPAEAPPDPSDPLVPSSQVAISETIEELAREGARRMLERALHSEVDGYLGRRRYDRVDDEFVGYRNGYAREREISIGTWAVEVRPPRVADTPGHIPPFRSSILPRGRNLTYPTQRLFARRYLGDERLGRVDRVVIGGPADADSDGDPLVALGHRRLADGAPDPFTDLGDVIGTRAWQQDQELLAPVADEGVSLADDASAGLRDGTEDPVAGQMPVRVVDRLEVVEIEHEEAQRVLGPNRS